MDFKMSLPQRLVLPSAREVTDVVEDAQCFILILKNKPPLLQYVYLFSEGDGLLCIFHIKRNVPPWSAGLATRSVVGFVAAKVVLLFETAKHFEGKFYYLGEKRARMRNILMLISFQTTFVLSQIWICGKNNVPLPSNCDNK